MNYYSHHIGDFRSGAFNMTRLERWIYRDMIDVYYDSESPLPVDFEDICDKLGVSTEEEQKVVTKILRLKFNLSERGYEHERCEEEIAAYRAKSETSKANGKLGGRPKKADENLKEPSGFSVGSDEVSRANPQLTGSEGNQEPITSNQEPSKSKASASSEKISLTADGEWTAIAPAQRVLWERAYPALSLDAELAKAAAWLMANPKNKKSNYARFLTNWFSRAQDSARPVANGAGYSQQQPNRQEALEARNREVAQRASARMALEFAHEDR